MPMTSELVQVPGAVAGFKFSPSGDVIESAVKEEEERLDEVTLDLLARICVANRAIANMQARGWEAISDMNGFFPVEGFTFIGLNLSVVTRGDQAVVLENSEADYDEAYRALER
ncbi:MAG: DUF2173 family protein [Pseudomonadota bacterium]